MPEPDGTDFDVAFPKFMVEEGLAYYHRRWFERFMWFVTGWPVCEIIRRFF